MNPTPEQLEKARAILNQSRRIAGTEGRYVWPHNEHELETAIATALAEVVVPVSEWVHEILSAVRDNYAPGTVTYDNAAAKLREIRTTAISYGRSAATVSAAEICAEMAREAERCTEEWHKEDGKFGGAGPEAEQSTRYSAMADALREAERRIRARVTTVPDASTQFAQGQLLEIADWVDPNKNPMPKDITWSILATRIRAIAESLVAATKEG